MEIGSCVKCAETFSACGCGSKAAERYEAYEDPITDRQEYKIDELGGKSDEDMTRSEASDYIKKLQGRESGTWRAESGPLPPDPRVSPLNTGLYSPSDTPTMAAEMVKKFNEGSRQDSTLIFIDLSGSTGEMRADGKPIKDSFMADIRKLIRGADSERFTIFGFGSSNGDGVLSDPYGRYTRLIAKDATPAEVRNSLKDFNKRFKGSMGGTRFPSSGLIDVILTELYSGDLSSYPSKTIILTDAYAPDMLRASWDAESFGAESKFDKLAKEIAEEYEEKGKSPKEAMEIGEATAAKIGRAKFGKRKFAKMGKKAEDDIDFDEAKADRNKDGRISDWERAVGNKVAKGIRDHKGAESAFDRLEDEVADEYEEKGMSDKEAQRIGAAVAYDQGVKKYGKKIMTEAARKGVSARSLERRAEVGAHVPTRIAATTTQRGVVKTYDSIPAGDGHVVGQFTPNMDYAPSGMYGAESITDSISKGFGSVLGIMSGLIIGGFAMNAVALLKSDDEN